MGRLTCELEHEETRRGGMICLVSSFTDFDSFGGRNEMLMLLRRTRQNSLMRQFGPRLIELWGIFNRADGLCNKVTQLIHLIVRLSLHSCSRPASSYSIQLAQIKSGSPAYYLSWSTEESAIPVLLHIIQSLLRDPFPFHINALLHPVRPPSPPPSPSPP